MDNKYDFIRDYAQKRLSCSAHNFDHIMRVCQNCLRLSENESVDMDVLIPAVLLHDICRVEEDADKTRNIDHAIMGAERASEFLKKHNWPSKKIDSIKHCIQTHRFRSTNSPNSLEAKILFDADKLDILGAVGIARSYILAGQFDERIFSEEEKNIENYINTNLKGGTNRGKIIDFSKHAPNLEFHTKFKYIPDRLFLPKSKEIAQQRLKIMETFFQQLKLEINF